MSTFAKVLVAPVLLSASGVFGVSNTEYVEVIKQGQKTVYDSAKSWSAISQNREYTARYSSLIVATLADAAAEGLDFENFSLSEEGKFDAEIIQLMKNQITEKAQQKLKQFKELDEIQFDGVRVGKGFPSFGDGLIAKEGAANNSKITFTDLYKGDAVLTSNNNKYDLKVELSKHYKAALESIQKTKKEDEEKMSNENQLEFIKFIGAYLNVVKDVYVEFTLKTPEEELTALNANAWKHKIIELSNPEKSESITDPKVNDPAVNDPAVIVPEPTEPKKSSPEPCHIVMFVLGGLIIVALLFCCFCKSSDDEDDEEDEESDEELHVGDSVNLIGTSVKHSRQNSDVNSHHSTALPNDADVETP